MANIETTGNGSHVSLSAGDHAAEPFFVEGGGVREAHFVLGAGARLHATAFVIAAGMASGVTSGKASGVAAGVASGSESARLSLTVDLAGPGAEFHLGALFVASESYGAAIDVRVNHLAPDCVSRQLVKGIAAGSATGSFTGMVHVAPGAQKTDASQRNQNLQLSDTAHIHTLPQLEIYADDVRCGHGATVGRLDEEAIYYMRQRGVSETDARRMQLHGFADEIVNMCPRGESCDRIAARVTALIDRL